MAKSTKNTYKPTKKGNLIPVVRMADGGNVSELNYSDRKAYIESHYAPFITDAQMIFSIYDSGIEYNYKGDRKEVVNSIIESYKSLADYTQITLPQETIYEIKDWELVRKDIDPDTDDVIGETPLKELSADNTYNFSYNGLVDLNWRVYEDEEYERYFYVITPHLGGDIRGNYGDALILQGNNKEELFYRYYEGFISGGASIYLKFKDGSEIAFDSEQDSDVFYFRLSEVFEPTGMAQTYLNDFEKFDTWYGDEFLEETIDIYLMRKGIAPKMMAGGSLNDETPIAYIQVLGYNEGKHFNLADYSDGQDVIDGIYEWMGELNAEFGGNREEYEVTDYEGFGSDLYDQYMSSNEFDEIIEGYEKYENSDFHSDIITAYRNDSGSGSNSLSDVIDEMDNNFFGKYESLQDFGYEMVQQGVYEPSDYDVYITDTDKRILAGEEADAVVDGMDFDELLNIAEGVKSEYESEISDLENKISDITTEIDELTSLQDDIENADDEEYEIISDQIEQKEVELDDIQNELDNIDSSFEDRAREQARDTFYDEIYDKLENDLSSWLEEYGYTENLQDISFLSVDYEKIGDEIGADYLIIEYDGQMYFFSNYAKGGRLMATKQKPKYDYYIVESSTKKLVSGYSTKKEALEQRKLLIEEYPSMRFEIYTLGNLESKTDLDVFSKKDYVQLSTLDKIKKVSVDAFRYGKEKVGQANEFLVRNDVKGKIKRGARNVADKTKQGFNWLRNQWNEADFGDGKGKAKFFADGGEVGNIKIGDEVYGRWNNANNWTSGIFKGETENGFEVYDFSIEKPDHIEYYAEISEDGYGGSKIYTSTKFKDRNYKNYHFSPFKDEYANGGGVEIGRTFESENDSLNTFKGYNNYFCIEFNGKVLHSVKTKSQHLKKLNELVDKYNLTEIKQKNSEFDDGGAVSDEIIIKSGNNGNLKVIYHAIKNQRTELNANEVFEQEKIKGKSVFLFVNDELYDEFIADGDENKYADGGGIENAEMPTRERTTITKPTTTPTTTPSKPDKDNPYKPKIKTRPKASKYDFILTNK